MRILFIVLGVAIFFSGNAEAARKTKKNHVAPVFSSKSFVVADVSGSIIDEQASTDIRPIASITKLMVGLIASEQDLDEQLDIPPIRHVRSSIPKSVSSLSRRELLTLSLVRSDNFAAQILCNNIDNCIKTMNDRAQSLGMVDTNFNEPTGLDRGNVSTAQDLLKLMMASASNQILLELSSMPEAEIKTEKVSIKVHNTNPLTSKLNIRLSKTGFTNPAGGCLVMIMDSPVGQRIFILLGSRNTRTRISDVKTLMRK